MSTEERSRSSCKNVAVDRLFNVETNWSRRRESHIHGGEEQEGSKLFSALGHRTYNRAPFGVKRNYAVFAEEMSTGETKHESVAVGCRRVSSVDVPAVHAASKVRPG